MASTQINCNGTSYSVHYCDGDVIRIEDFSALMKWYDKHGLTDYPHRWTGKWDPIHQYIYDLDEECPRKVISPATSTIIRLIAYSKRVKAELEERNKQHGTFRRT